MSAMATQLEQMISVLASIWTRECRSCVQNLDLPASCAIVALMQPYLADTTYTEIAASFIAYFDNRSTLARLLLKHADMCCKWAAPYRKHFALEADLIGLLITADQDLKEALLLRSSVRKFCYALSTFLAQTPDVATARSVLLCVQYFHATLDATDGVTWVRQAVRAGILPALLDCVKFYEHHNDIDEEVVSLLSKISRHLLYKSVFREARRSWSEVSSKERASSWSTMRRNERTSTAWSNFEALLVARLRVKHAYNKDFKYATCAAQECGKSGLDLKACKDCLSTRYCSRTCQENDWQTHKGVCRQMRVLRRAAIAAGGGPFAEDLRFITYVIRYDLIYNRTLFRARSAILAQNPDAIGFPFGVVLDYRFSPTRLQVISTNSYNLSPIPTEGLLTPASVATYCAEKRGTDTYVQFHLPSGQVRASYSMVSPDLGDWDRIVNGRDASTD
ncbi:hypothetical protein DFH06DRAFT_581957 [Mycena polygramma]|nr:hypothetical protein DFH06DRAFT_581957 [Mycena polygramma]